MKLMVPTVMCKAMLAMDYAPTGHKAGQIVDMPYGHALSLFAVGGITAIMDADAKHIEAQEQLGTYGGDCWFPPRQQTVSYVAEYLARTNVQTTSVQ